MLRNSVGDLVFRTLSHLAVAGHWAASLHREAGISQQISNRGVPGKRLKVQ